MGSRKIELVLICLTILLGALTIWLGTFNPLWVLLDVSAEHRGALTIALSIAVILIGFLSTLYVAHAGHLEKIKEVVASLPQAQLLTFYPNGDEALQRLTDAVRDAKTALNTVVTEGESARQLTPAVEKWNKERFSLIRKGEVVFRDVVSAGHRTEAEHWLRKVAKSKASYQAVCIECNLKAFLNFIVLTHKNNLKEVWFGWPMSASFGYDQPCVRTSDKIVVQLFENWHAALCDGGHLIEVSPG